MDGGIVDDDASEASDDDWGEEGWDEPEAAPTQCLFTSQVFDTAALCLAHAKATYGLDLAGIAANLKLDIYGRVQLVNYVRSRAAQPGAQPALIAADVNSAAVAGDRASCPWLDEKYLMPVLAEDPLLYSIPPASASADAAAAASAPTTTAADDDDDADEVGGLQPPVDGEANLLETIEQMRTDMATLLGLDDGAAGGSSGAAASKPDVSDGDASNAAAAAAAPPTTATSKASSNGKAAASSGSSDSAWQRMASGLGDSAKPSGPTEGQYGSQAEAGTAYFDSYAKLAIHEEMLGDAVRTQGYLDAIEKNASLFKGKTVLDVGCGSGILSMFAARAGAARVIAVDASDIVDLATRIVSANKLADKISVVRGTMESLTLPDGVEKVDIIISEWMGYALLYESMLPSVLFARDKYLAEGGYVLPSSCEMYLSLSDSKRLTFWDDVYGFEMGVIKEQALKEATVEVVPEESLLSHGAPCHFRNVDCTSTNDKALDFSTSFKLVAGRAGTLRCFVIHFDTIFDLSGEAGGVKTSFTTSPEAVPTHWKQSSLYLRTPLELAAGDTVVGTISLSRGLEYKRAYDFTVTYSIDGKAGDKNMNTTTTTGARAMTQLWRME